MITAQINNNQREYAEHTTILDIVSDTTGRALDPTGSPTDGRRLGVAVAVNGGVIARSQWANTALAQGDTVEIVTAVQGG